MWNIKHLVGKTIKSVEKSKTTNNFKVGDKVQAPDPFGKHNFRHGVVTAVQGNEVFVELHCTHSGSDTRGVVKVGDKFVGKTITKSFHFSQLRNSL